MKETGINLVADGDFTIARVCDQVAAVGWVGNDGLYYVADGTGPAFAFRAEEPAVGRMASIAARRAGEAA